MFHKKINMPFNSPNKKLKYFRVAQRDNSVLLAHFLMEEAIITFSKAMYFLVRIKILIQQFKREKSL